jgi:hypothetical protein
VAPETSSLSSDQFRDEELAVPSAHGHSLYTVLRDEKRQRRKVGVMAKQVGPALGKPITTLALEAAVIDWLPCA